MTIERGGKKIADGAQAPIVGLRDHFKVEIEDGHDLKVHGNIVDHEYEIERDGTRSPRSRRSGSGVRDTYGVEIEADQDDALHPRDHGGGRRPDPRGALSRADVRRRRIRP